MHTLSPSQIQVHFFFIFYFWDEVFAMSHRQFWTRDPLSSACQFWAAYLPGGCIVGTHTHTHMHTKQTPPNWATTTTKLSNWKWQKPPNQQNKIGTWAPASAPSLLWPHCPIPSPQPLVCVSFFFLLVAKDGSRALCMLIMCFTLELYPQAPEQLTTHIHRTSVEIQKESLRCGLSVWASRAGTSVHYHA